MTGHLNDGTLAPEMAEWLRRYVGGETWIVELADAASVGVPPMPSDLRRLASIKIANAADGWRSLN